MTTVALHVYDATIFLLLVAASSVALASADGGIVSGSTLLAAPGSNPPLATGVDSFPVGVADVFGGEHPDLFVMSNRHTGPYSPAGLVLYKFLRRDRAGTPHFQRSGVVSIGTSFSHIKAGAIAQTSDGTIHGVFLVRAARGAIDGELERAAPKKHGRSGTTRQRWGAKARRVDNAWPVVMHSVFDKATSSFVSPKPVRIGKKDAQAWVEVSGAYFLPCQPKYGPSLCTAAGGGNASVGSGPGDGIIVMDITDQPSNVAPKEDGWVPFSSQGVWRGGSTPFATLYSLDPQTRLHALRKVTPGAQGVPYSFCVSAQNPAQHEDPDFRPRPYICPRVPPRRAAGRAGHQGRARSTGRGPLTSRRAYSQGVGLVNGTTSTTMVTGSFYGGLHAFQVEENGPQGWALSNRAELRGPDGNFLSHPTIHAYPVVYPGGGKVLKGGEQTSTPGLIVGGEGALYYYHGTGVAASNGSWAPTFRPPVHVVEEGAALYGGSLAVPNLVDWDGDGLVDIVAGNSEGRLLFFRNAAGGRVRGRRRKAPPPAPLTFQPGEDVLVGGEPLVVRQFRPIQGPQETGYGYTSPAVIDWNGDGLLDVVLNDATYQHTVFINRGTRTRPALALGRLLRVHGTPLTGGFRTKPGVALISGTIFYVAVDHDDQLHAYSRLDDTNMKDAGPLQLTTGLAISCSFRNWPGSSGRISIVVEDWDLDGLPDLLLGTHQFSSVPSPENGMPRGRGAQVLFLKGIAGPGPMGVVFAAPEDILHQGDAVMFGSHRCTPAVLRDAVDGEEGPHLLVGEQGGRFVFFKRSALSSRTYPGGFPVSRSPQDAPAEGEGATRAGGAPAGETPGGGHPGRPLNFGEWEIDTGRMMMLLLPLVCLGSLVGCVGWWRWSTRRRALGLDY